MRRLALFLLVALLAAVPVCAEQEQAEERSTIADQLMRCGTYYLVASTMLEDDEPVFSEKAKLQGFEHLVLAQKYSDGRPIKEEVARYTQELISNPGALDPEWEPACREMLERHSAAVAADENRQENGSR